jgi:hypothetical protein
MLILSSRAAFSFQLSAFSLQLSAFSFQLSAFSFQLSVSHTSKKTRRSSMASLRMLKNQEAVAVTKRKECQDMKPEIENRRERFLILF